MIVNAQVSNETKVTIFECMFKSTMLQFGDQVEDRTYISKLKDNPEFNSGLSITIEMLKKQCKMTQVFQLGILNPKGVIFFPR